MPDNEYTPGAKAPKTGDYEELNVLGVPTGVMIHRTEGDLLPGLLRGFTWRLVQHQP